MSDLGPLRPRMIGADQRTSARANIRWWDADADAYHAEHGEFLGVADFLWCPENVREADTHLLGDIAGKRVLEVGCGSAPCSRWLAAQGAHPVAFDISGGMLRHARAGNAATGLAVPLVQADVSAIPFRDGVFDLAFSAFGGLPFVADAGRALSEVARVLLPGGRFVFSVNHPMRWMFRDDPGPDGLTAIQSYFDRSPYVEVDEHDIPAYVEHHRTVGDWVRALVGAGFVLDDLIEPEWPEGFDGVWGQWSALRGEIFPGTAIFVAHTVA